MWPERFRGKEGCRQDPIGMIWGALVRVTVHPSAWSKSANRQQDGTWHACILGLQENTNQVLLYALCSVWVAGPGLRPLIGSSSARVLGDLFRMGLELLLSQLFLELLVSYVLIGVVRPLHQGHELAQRSCRGELSPTRCAGCVVSCLGGREWCN